MMTVIRSVNLLIWEEIQNHPSGEDGLLVVQSEMLGHRVEGLHTPRLGQLALLILENVLHICTTFCALNLQVATYLYIRHAFILRIASFGLTQVPFEVVSTTFVLLIL